jgi:uncharacterized protein (DUF433 family)
MGKELLDRIVVDPKVMVGKPVIKGTRITVEHILRLLAEGQSRKEIFEGYPHLTDEDISAALFYGAEVLSDEDIIPIEMVK